MEKLVRPVIHHAGDQAFLVEFGSSYGLAVGRAVMCFDRLVTAAKHEAILETSPTMRSVLIRFDPAILSARKFECWIRDQLQAYDWNDLPTASVQGRWSIPVLYGGEHGPDLAEVAETVGLNEKDAAALHASQALRVLCLGFSPGLAYLAELPVPFDLPRRKAFGPRVPEGAILVANRQTVLPASPIPTGWLWIGTTPLRTFRPDLAQPFLLSPGDNVQFYQMSRAAFADFNDREYWDKLGAKGA